MPIKKYSYNFVKEQIEKEGYKLLSTEYKNSRTKLKVQCDKGHIYEPIFNNFQRGGRCLVCKNKKLHTDRKYSYEFIKEQIEKEGYNLISTEYINAHTKLEIQCNKGHKYRVTYNSFQRGCRCPICFGTFKYSYEYIKDKIKGIGYNLISTEYKGVFEKIKIQCDKGHEYDATYDGLFQQGNRCPYCFGNAKLTYEFIKEQIEKEEGYKLISNQYENSSEKIEIQCDKGHEYKVKYNHFQRGERCPKCFGSFSRAEKEVSEYIKSLNLEIIENDKQIIKPLELDIVIPEKKIAIEYCGLYWHSEEAGKDKNYHLNKLNLCNKAGYRLITIFEDEWLNKQGIVKSRLKHILGLETERIYARKCEVKEISKEQAKIFIDTYHIQGYINSSICLGAFYENELVAVNTFIQRGNEFELNRFCTSKNVVGIAGKLLEYFKRNYNYDKIETFADSRWSEGNLYEKIGFVKDQVLRPDYSYFKVNNSRYHKFNFRHKQMKNKLENYNHNLSERENMKNNYWYRIYDCGKIRYNYI